MKIVLKDVGCLTEAVIEPGELTVFCGANNTGKTYAMYVLWTIFRRRFQGVFSYVEQLAIDLKTQGVIGLSLKEIIDQQIAALEEAMSQAATNYLPILFAAPSRMFSNARIDISVDRTACINHALSSGMTAAFSADDDTQLLDVRSEQDSDILTITLTTQKLPQELIAEFISRSFFDLFLGYHASSAFLLPAERGGLNIFYPDLDTKNSALIRHIKRDDSNPLELIRTLMVAQYAEPIDAYLQFLRKLPRSLTDKTTFHDDALTLQKQIARVSYKVSNEGVITARPDQSDVELHIHLTSSTVKNLFGLWAYLEATAKSGDCLMIDEPELNLHPDNQRLVARLLARLVNRGIKVVISTHSDYIVREINNMLMLGNEFPERQELERKWGYDPDGTERLRLDQVAAYHFEETQVSRIEISPEYGMEVKSMDDAINRMNESNSEIYFALQDTLCPVQTPDFVSEPEERCEV